MLKEVKRGRKGQATVFIIVAIVIVLIVVGVIVYPRVVTVGGAEFSPSSYLKSCIEPELRGDVELLAKNGGYANPEGFVVYQDQKFKYLCYTNKYYEKCVVQQPLIKENFEGELKTMINAKTVSCVQSLKAELERRGSSVSLGSVQSSVSAIPKKIKIDITAPMTVTQETSQTYREFSVDFDSEMYDLMLIATSIIDYETTYGDAETTLYMQYYPDLKIEKLMQSDGTRIYKISNVVTKEEFDFASRSIAWPPGYAGG